MAGRRPLLRIGSDVSEARRGLQQIKDDARDFARVRAEARVQIQTDAANARLDVLNARLERYSRQEQTATVKIATGRAAAEIDRIEARLDRLSHKDVNVTVRVRQSVLGSLSGAGSRTGGSGLTGFAGTLIGGATSGISALAGAAGSGVQAVAGLIPGLSAGAAGVAGLGASVVVVLPLLAAFAALVVSIGAVLVALGASLIAAAAGAAVLGAAFGAALAGPAILVVAAISKVVAIFGALKTQEQQHVSNTAAMQAAAAQRVAAQEQLAAAIKNVAEQRIAAQQAEQDAARAIPRDQLGIDQAKLGIEQAREAIRKFRQEAGLAGGAFNSSFQKFTDVSFHPTTKNISGALGGKLDKSQELELEQLILNQRSAVFGLSDALEKLKRDRQTDANFARNGLKAYGPYASALDQVAAAQRRVEAATRAATKSQATQQGKLAELTPREQALARALGRIKDAFENAFGPAVDNVLGGIVRGVSLVARALEGPRIRSALTSLGTALGGAFARIGRFFSSPANIAALVAFINAGKRLVRPLTDLFIAFSKVIRDLALDALPRLIRGVRTFARDVTTWEKHNGGVKKLRGTVGGLIDSFNDWVKIIRGISLILLAFLRGSKKDGDSFAGSLGDILVKWGRFLNTKKGQAGIISFFDSIKRLIKDAIKELEHLIALWEKVSSTIGKLKHAAGGGGPGGSLLSPINPLLGILGIGHSKGGLIGGTGRGDHVPALLEPGEFVVKRAVVDAVGLPALMRLNAGAPVAMAAAGGSAGPVTRFGDVHLHVTTAGGGQMHPDLVIAQLGQRLGALGNG